MPAAQTQQFAIALAAVGFGVWVAAASAGVNSMGAFLNAVAASGQQQPAGQGCSADLKDIAKAIWNAQLASLLASLLLGAVFCVGGYFLWKKTPAEQRMSRATMACLVAAVFSIVLCVATSSALIDGTTYLGILSEDESQALTDATNEARTAPVAVLCLGIAAAIAFVAGFVVLYKKGKGAEAKSE